NRIVAWLPLLNARNSLVQRGLPPLNDCELVLNSYQLSLVTRWSVKPATVAEGIPSAFSSRGNRSQLAYSQLHSINYDSCIESKARGLVPAILIELDRCAVLTTDTWSE